MSDSELQRLRDRVAELEAILGIHQTMNSRLRAAFALQPDHARILGILLKRQLVTFDTLYSVLYGERAECDQPVDKAVHVQIHKLRKKLRPLDIAISTVVSEGYVLRPEAKRRVEALLAQFEGSQVGVVVTLQRPSSAGASVAA